MGSNGVSIEDPADLKREKRDMFGEIYELDERKYPTEGIIVKAYFTADKKWKNQEKEIRKKIDSVEKYDIDLGNNKLSTKLIKDEDWENEWKKYFKPMNVTDRFTIVPSWES